MTAQSTTTRGSRYVRRALGALGALCALLLVPATLFVRHPSAVIGSGVVDPEAPALAQNPALSDAGPVLLVGGKQPVSLALKPHTVALTFDDGPSEDWTRAIQAVLDEHHVPGTFFVTGTNAAKYPDVVRELAAAGHELGNHTYTHPNMSSLSPWQIDAQLRLTDRVVAGITGQRPTVYRPPYSGSAMYLSPADYAAAKEALGGDGRLLVLSDRLPRDFDDAVGVDQVVADALPLAPGASAVITLHDAGGDRSKTVDALRILIPKLQAEGYSFVRASEIIDPAVVPRLATSGREADLGRSLLAATSIVNLGFDALWVVAIVGVVLGLLRIVLLVHFARRFRRRATPIAPDAPPYVEPVTVIIPAYNEEVGIAAAVLSIAASDYPDVLIIVVDDGSSDATSEIVELLRLDNVTLIRQPNSGKPTALNTGIAAATTDIVVLVDGDTIFDPNTVRDAVQPFRDPSIGAVAGNAKVGNRAKVITRMQHVEYTVASEIERRMWGVLGVSPCVPGAIGAFRRSALIEAGGLSQDTLAEDSDLTIALARAGWKIDYVPTARAWTEAPSSWRGLLRQRRRWSYGVLQVMAKHRRALFERGRGGRVARVAFPYQLLTSYAFAIVAPAIDLVMLHDLAFAPHSRLSTLVVWSALNLVNTAVNVYALRLDGERIRSVWWVAFAQQFLYRQVLYIAALRSIAAAVVGVRLPWQTPRRVGGVVSIDRDGAVAQPAFAAPSAPAPVSAPQPRIFAEPRRASRPADALIVPDAGWLCTIDGRALTLAACNPRHELLRDAALPGVDLTRFDGALVSGSMLPRTEQPAPIEAVASWPLLLADSLDRVDQLPTWPTDWSVPLSLRQVARLLGDEPGPDLTQLLHGTDLADMGESLWSPTARALHASGLLAQHPASVLAILDQMGCLTITADGPTTIDLAATDDAAALATRPAGALLEG